MQHDGIHKVPTEDLAIAPMMAHWSRDKPYAGHAVGVMGGSSLGKCAKATQFFLNGVKKTNPMDESGFHATGIGSAVHLAIQEQAAREINDTPGEASAEMEHPWNYHSESGPLHIESDGDIVIWTGPQTEPPIEVVEIKTMQSYPFKMLANGSDGPRREHILQAGFGARALGAQQVRIVAVLPTELKGRDRVDSKGDVCDFRTNRYVEFTFRPEDVADLLDEEEARLNKIIEWNQQGRSVPRSVPGMMPKGARIVDPRTALWQLWVPGAEEGAPVLLESGGGGSKRAFPCGYCDWQEACIDEIESEQA